VFLELGRSALIASELAIGYVGLNHSSACRGRDEAELGFRLARAHWRKGYGLGAARLGLQHAFAGVGLRRVIAKVDPSNVGSVAVVERLGMQFERLIMVEGYTHPDRLYVCARGEQAAR
jgi:RimJ/RimL family protein N-acetyltransferase